MPPRTFGHPHELLQNCRIHEKNNTVGDMIEHFFFPVFCKISNFDMGESYVLKASFLNSSSFTRVTLLEQPSLVNKQDKKEEKNVPRIWME